MFPTKYSGFRYLRLARRTQLARLAAAGAIVLLPVACGNGEADVFDSASASTTSPDAAATTTTADTAATTTADTTAETTTIAAATPETAVPATVEMVVEFTYSATSSAERVRNPYIAVWVEDTEGNLVDTISVWFKQSGEGTKWLDDLRSWYSATGGNVDAATSGATRSAGTYAVVWDGTDTDGNSVDPGEYVLFVEAAREHGPYSITSTSITLGSAAFSVTLADEGELSSLTATLTV